MLVNHLNPDYAHYPNPKNFGEDCIQFVHYLADTTSRYYADCTAFASYFRLELSPSDFREGYIVVRNILVK
jgi:hypothetical protein